MNKNREPFRKFKELRIMIGTGMHEATMVPYTYDRNAEQIHDMVSNISITPNTGIVLTIKENGKRVHVKYNNHTFEYSLGKGVLIFKDIELYTPFVYDPSGDKNHKWISWDEWESNERYTTINDIVVPWDERLSEHDTDLEYILSKVCMGCEIASYAKANFKQNIVYDGNGYHIDMAYGECYLRANNGERYHIKHRYYASENTINVDIQHLVERGGTHEISFKFNDKHSLIEIKIKHGSIVGMLRFMDINNTALREYINRIRDFINMKMTDHKLVMHIDYDADGYTQTWTISSRCDVPTKKKQKLTSEDIRKAMERGKAYDIEHTYFSTVVKYLFDEFGLTTDPSDINGAYTGDASNKNENIFVSINKEACTVSLSVYNKLDDNKRIVVKMEFDNEDGFIHTVSVESTFKDYYDLSDAISSKTRTTLYGLGTLLKSATTSNRFTLGVLDEHPFRLNLNGDIYTQIKNECEWIYNHPNITQTDELNRTTIWGGSVLSLSSGTFEEATREKIHFHFDTFGTFRRITIEILDPNREKLKVTLGIEGSQLVSIALKPGFDNFEKVIDRIYNPRVKRLVSEIFNKLYKGEE